MSAHIVIEKVGKVFETDGRSMVALAGHQISRSRAASSSACSALPAAASRPC
jgi:hypothetical protein